MEKSMLTELLWMLRAPKHFEATYCDGEIYVAEVEQAAAADSARPAPAPAELIGSARKSSG
jgi:hypothetical protein